LRTQISRPQVVRRGVFVAVDGPGGVGKTTTVTAVTALLRSAGVPTWTTAEPSDSDIGQLARVRVHKPTSGLALTCLFAADRYQQLDEEIRPQLAAGTVVVTDRYLASGLVMQRHDGVDLEFLRALNARADRPDLAVILTADADTVAARLRERGAHNRYQLRHADTVRELELFVEAGKVLGRSGVHVLVLNTATTPPAGVAAAIRDRIDSIREEPLNQRLPL
jgi:dTMP kinase